MNGAIYLGREKEIGSVAVGKNADLVVIKGDPSKQVSDIENVEIVFDPQKLLNSVGANMDSIERASAWTIEFSVPESQTACSSEPVQGRLSAIRNLKTTIAFLLDYREI